MAVGVLVAVAVGVAVGVGVAVCVAVGVAVGVAVDVAVDVAVGVAVGVGVTVGVGRLLIWLCQPLNCWPAATATTLMRASSGYHSSGFSPFQFHSLKLLTGRPSEFLMAKA